MRVAFVSIGDRPQAEYTGKSFKKHHPDCQVIQVTDWITPQAPYVDEVIRKEYTDHMMLFMIQSFAELDFDGGFITTGDDCVLVKPLKEELDCEIAVVRRKNKMFFDECGNFGKFTHRWAYSNGLVIVNNPTFYKDCLKSIEGMKDEFVRDRNFWDWWGDMAAVSEVAQSGKYRIKDLPEEHYSYKPKFYQDYGNDKTVLLHYAGNKKHWMKDLPL